ncbi:MAG: hypothetical protein P1U61_04835 [Legionellaceae bacterium]|nr:hypothetical protein [Legionellaceae bacterium]
MRTKTEYSKESLMSPAKATPAHSPHDGTGCIAFFHYNTEQAKKTGLTPGESREIPLDSYEGEHHLKFKSPGQKIYRRENDFYRTSSFDKKYKFLLLTLTNLKSRIDNHYERPPKSQDQRHYTAIFIQIQRSLHMLKEMVNLPEHVQEYDFLQKLNQAITSKKFNHALYNPIDMLPCYQDKHFSTYTNTSVDIACGHQTPLTKASIQAISLNIPLLTNILSSDGIPISGGVPVVQRANPKQSPSRAALSSSRFASLLDAAKTPAEEDEETHEASTTSSDTLSTSSSDASRKMSKRERPTCVFTDIPDESLLPAPPSGFKKFALTPSSKSTPGSSAKKRKRGELSKSPFFSETGEENSPVQTNSCSTTPNMA